MGTVPSGPSAFTTPDHRGKQKTSLFSQCSMWTCTRTCVRNTLTCVCKYAHSRYLSRHTHIMRACTHSHRVHTDVYTDRVILLIFPQMSSLQMSLAQLLWKECGFQVIPSSQYWPTVICGMGGPFQEAVLFLYLAVSTAVPIVWG